MLIIFVAVLLVLGYWYYWWKLEVLGHWSYDVSIKQEEYDDDVFGLVITFLSRCLLVVVEYEYHRIICLLSPSSSAGAASFFTRKRKRRRQRYEYSTNRIESIHQSRTDWKRSNKKNLDLFPLPVKSQLFCRYFVVNCGCIFIWSSFYEFDGRYCDRTSRTI